jgi:hypothetical protein
VGEEMLEEVPMAYFIFSTRNASDPPMEVQFIRSNASNLYQLKEVSTGQFIAYSYDKTNETFLTVGTTTPTALFAWKIAGAITETPPQWLSAATPVASTAPVWEVLPVANPVKERLCKNVPIQRAKCTQGCARWSALSADGNTANQHEVHIQFWNGTAPDDGCCAKPHFAAPHILDGHDSPWGWCYCKGANDSSILSCRPPVPPREDFSRDWLPSTQEPIADGAVCEHGCANWAALDKEAIMPIIQNVADAQFLEGRALNGSGCAKPYWNVSSIVGGGLPWCYCRRRGELNSHDEPVTAFGYCTHQPQAPVPHPPPRTAPPTAVPTIAPKPHRHGTTTTTTVVVVLIFAFVLMGILVGRWRKLQRATQDSPASKSRESDVENGHADPLLQKSGEHDREHLDRTAKVTNDAGSVIDSVDLQLLLRPKEIKERLDDWASKHIRMVTMFQDGAVMMKALVSSLAIFYFTEQHQMLSCAGMEFSVSFSYSDWMQPEETFISGNVSTGTCEYRDWVSKL